MTHDTSSFAIAFGIFYLMFGFPAWRIVRKTGHNPWLHLLFFVPFVNIAMFWFLALSKWPALQRAGGSTSKG